MDIYIKVNGSTSPAQSASEADVMTQDLLQRKTATNQASILYIQPKTFPKVLFSARQQ